MIALTCPLCSGAMKLSEDKNFATCEYCGNTIKLEDIEEQHWEHACNRGYIELEDGDYARAEEFFEQAINLNPSCARAYLGKLLARQNCISLEEMVKQRLYDSNQVEYQAVTMEVQRQADIQDIVNRCSIPNYLEADRLMRLFDFNGDYISLVHIREFQLVQEQEFFQKNILCRNIMKYGSPDEQSAFQAAQEDIYSEMRTRIEHAREQDETTHAALRAAYDRHFALASRQAEELHAQASQERQADYEAARELMNRGASLQDYLDAIQLFEKLQDYRDSSERIPECRSEAEQLLRSQKRGRSFLTLILKISLAVAGVIICAIFTTPDNYEWTITLTLLIEIIAYSFLQDT